MKKAATILAVLVAVLILAPGVFAQGTTTSTSRRHQLAGNFRRIRYGACRGRLRLRTIENRIFRLRRHGPQSRSRRRDSRVHDSRTRVRRNPRAIHPGHHFHANLQRISSVAQPFLAVLLSCTIRGPSAKHGGRFNFAAPAPVAQVFRSEASRCQSPQTAINTPMPCIDSSAPPQTNDLSSPFKKLAYPHPRGRSLSVANKGLTAISCTSVCQ